MNSLFILIVIHFHQVFMKSIHLSLTKTRVSARLHHHACIHYYLFKGHQGKTVTTASLSSLLLPVWTFHVFHTSLWFSCGAFGFLLLQKKNMHPVSVNVSV